MKYTFALLAAAIAVQASPFPQAVTAKISPSAKPPPGCKGAYSGTFGIAVMNISTAAKSKRQVSTIADGQPQATTGVAPVSTISDGQPQATTGVVPVSTISDGQPQASTGVAPISTIADGQPQAPTKTTMAMPKPMHTMGHVSQITDGQIQGGMHTVTMMAVSQISDGQIQGPKKTITYMAITTIVDGQPQAPTLPAISTISDGQPQAPKQTVHPVSTISDGQPQATTGVAPVSTIADGQPQATTAVAPVSTISDGQPQATTAKAPVSTINDGQPQASTGTKVAVSTISDTQPQATTGKASAAPVPTMATQMVACKTNSSLEITLKGGVLTDSIGRTGYIASNYQFQFDKPPQAGAIYTAGWSVCANGSLALGGSNVFYQCLSGNFYNLYNKDWASQCSPITINSLMLVDCA